MAAKVLVCGLCICFLTDLVRLGKHLEWCEASHRYAKFFPVAAKCFSASLHILPYLALKCLYVALYICFLPDLLRSGKHLAYLGGFTGVSCDIMPSALRWQLSAIRWHCISFLSYLVLFGKHLTNVRRHPYRRVEPFWRREELGEGRIRATWGWISVDRGSKATLPLTMPRRVFKSSAKDSAHRPFGRELRGGRPQHIGRTGLANGTGPWGRKRP